jgi:predicted Mrr-cat superfamily restriction endonuclease
MPIFTVRADSGQYTDAFRRGGYAGIGWFDTLLDDTSTREAIGAHYRDNFLGQSVGTAGQNVGQINRFLNTIQPGDWLITPYSNSEGALLVGQVQSGAAYFAPPGTDECPYGYRRPVRWESRLLYRRQFSESLRNTLGSTLTVFQVPQEQEVLAVLAGEPLVERPLTATAFGPEQAHEAVRQKLLELSAQEFEVLVSYVLRVLGFEGHVTRLSGDGGIDFEGELRVHGVAHIKLQVQVKRYTNTQINETELRNFRGALKEGHQGCFITLSDFSRATRDSAANAQLRSVNLINGRQFVELFVQYYDLLLKLLAEEEADDLAAKLRFRKALLPG